MHLIAIISLCMRGSKNRFSRLETETTATQSERVNERQLGAWCGGMLPRKHFKLKSSEMARNASKIVNTDVNF